MVFSYLYPPNFMNKSIKKRNMSLPNLGKVVALSFSVFWNNHGSREQTSLYSPRLSFIQFDFTFCVSVVFMTDSLRWTIGRRPFDSRSNRCSSGSLAKIYERSIGA